MRCVSLSLSLYPCLCVSLSLSLSTPVSVYLCLSRLMVSNLTSRNNDLYLSLSLSLCNSSTLSPSSCTSLSLSPSFSLVKWFLSSPRAPMISISLQVLPRAPLQHQPEHRGGADPAAYRQGQYSGLFIMFCIVQLYYISR